MSTEFEKILNQKIKTTRWSNQLYSGSITAVANSVTYQPAYKGRIEVGIAGCTDFGIVNIWGTTTESITFTSNRKEYTGKDFTTVEGFSTLGFGAGTITLKAIESGGAPIQKELTIYDELDVFFYAKSSGMKVIAPGEVEIADFMFLTAYTGDVLQGDFVYPIEKVGGLEKGQVTSLDYIYDFDGVTLHLEAGVKKI